MGTYGSCYVQAIRNGVWTDITELDMQQIYDLYAILADVRNYRQLKPIGPMKGRPPMPGKPEDKDRRWWDRDDEEDRYDCKSVTYFTLTELFAVDWTQTAKARAACSLRSYFWWRKYPGAGLPYKCLDFRTEEEAVDWVAKTPHTVVTAEEVEKLLKARGYPEVKDVNKEHAIEQLVAANLNAGTHEALVLVHCSEPYYVIAQHLWKDLIPQVCHLGKPDEVRLVFAFD